MSETMVIGDLKLPIAEINFVVKYKSARKVTKAVAQGDDDATATDGGRQVREVTIKFTWPDRAEVNQRAKPLIERLDPSKMDKDDPPSFAHERNGLDLAAAKHVNAILVEDASGPDLTAEGSGINVYELKCTSWHKVTKGTGKTPDGSKGFVLGSEHQVVNGSQVTAKRGPGAAKPSVKP